MFVEYGFFINIHDDLSGKPKKLKEKIVVEGKEKIKRNGSIRAAIHRG